MSYQPPPRQQPPNQYGYPGAQPYPAQPPMGEAPRPKRGRRGVIAAVVAVAVVAGIGGGVWLWQRDGGSSAASQSDLPTNPNLATLAVPDPDKLGYGGGAAEMCGNVEKVMSQRGYRRSTEGVTEGGIYCRSITPALSLLEDGSYNILADVAVWRDNAEERYQRFLDKATGERDVQKNNPEYRLSKIEQFPAGDVGFIFHREADTQGMNRADTEAIFRSGGDVMMISVWGSIEHVGGEVGEPPPSEPLTEEITYREITDVLMALSGEGQPGKPQITAPNLQESPILAALRDLEPPTGSTDEVCGKAAAAAGQLGVKRKDGNTCVFEPIADEDAENYHQEGYVERDITVGVEALAKDSNVDKLGNDLKSLSDRTTGDGYQRGPLYELPVGDGGYAIHYSLREGMGFLQAGYTLDGTHYTLIEIRGFKKTGGELVALTEQELFADLATLLTAMAG